MPSTDPPNPASIGTEQDLHAPVLLLAMPQVLDPYFYRSVVLLAHHEEEGSYGFILNKPTEIKVAEILQGMEIDWEGPREALAHFGGPVQPQIGTVLYDTSDGDPLSTTEEEGGDEDPLSVGRQVLPGIAFTQRVGDLSHLAQDPPAGGMRLFLGYAGWGEGQLIEEILRNDWLTAPVDSRLVFQVKPQDVWEQALKSVGIDAGALPSWTGGGSGPTN